MIWIIGGTSETRDLVSMLQGKVEFIVTSATEEARQFQENIEIQIERMDLKRMEEFIQSCGIAKAVDLSHPYAFEVSENAINACLNRKIPYYRFVREKTKYQDIICFGSVKACAKYLSGVSGTVFFTTGSKYVKEFQKARGNNRFVYRLLPTKESIEECLQNEVEIKNIVAMLGPFSKSMNIEMFGHFQANYVVMKNSGKRGGTLEKIEACNNLRITPLMIERDDEKGWTDLNSLAQEILSN